MQMKSVKNHKLAALLSCKIEQEKNRIRYLFEEFSLVQLDHVDNRMSFLWLKDFTSGVMNFPVSKHTEGRVQ